MHLNAAFRSLSRPSSPPRAKASAMRPFLLSVPIRRITVYVMTDYTNIYGINRIIYTNHIYTISLSYILSSPINTLQQIVRRYAFTIPPLEKRKHYDCNVSGKTVRKFVSNRNSPVTQHISYRYHIALIIHHCQDGIPEKSFVFSFVAPCQRTMEYLQGYCA